jgi:hypothetical protein
MTNDELKALRDIANNSTRVVAWYPHYSEVRGPFCRWFTCSDVSDIYKKDVSSKENDCNFAAAAMNNLVPLLDEVELLRAESKKLKCALEKAVDVIKQMRSVATNGESSSVEWLADEFINGLAIE